VAATELASVVSRFSVSTLRALKTLLSAPIQKQRGSKEPAWVA
jgi:hypothetical protein